MYSEDGVPMEREGGSNYHFSPQSCAVFPGNLLGADDRDSTVGRAIAVFIEDHPPNKNAITPDPIVAARMGMTDRAVEMLSNCVRRLQHFPQGFFYNIDHWFQLSLYKDKVDDAELVTQRDYVNDRRCRYESGLPAKPFIQFGMEPIGILGAAVNEMLLQSYDGTIRVFPAVPEEWEAAFMLRAVGGFSVSAEKADPEGVRYVAIRSDLGNRCRLAIPWAPEEGIAIRSSEGPVDYTKERDDRISFPTRPGANYTIVRAADAETEVSGQTFSGTVNKEPKRYHEATLGKSRDF